MAPRGDSAGAANSERLVVGDACTIVGGDGKTAHRICGAPHYPLPMHTRVHVDGLGTGSYIRFDPKLLGCHRHTIDFDADSDEDQSKTLDDNVKTAINITNPVRLEPECSGVARAQKPARRWGRRVAVKAAGVLGQVYCGEGNCCCRYSRCCSGREAGPAAGWIVLGKEDQLVGHLHVNCFPQPDLFPVPVPAGMTLACLKHALFERFGVEPVCQQLQVHSLDALAENGPGGIEGGQMQTLEGEPMQLIQDLVFGSNVAVDQRLTLVPVVKPAKYLVEKRRWDHEFVGRQLVIAEQTALAHRMIAAGCEDCKFSTVLAAATIFCGSGSSSSSGNEVATKARSTVAPTSAVFVDVFAGCVFSGAMAAAALGIVVTLALHYTGIYQCDDCFTSHIWTTLMVGGAVGGLLSPAPLALQRDRSRYMKALARKDYVPDKRLCSWTITRE